MPTTEQEFGCDQCEVLTINGISCHEIGCLNSWRNPATQKGFLVACAECGCDFEPFYKPGAMPTCYDCFAPDPYDFDIDDD